MKRFSKVLAVALTLFTLCIAPLSAQDGDRIVITSNIPQVEPVFGIKGSPIPGWLEPRMELRSTATWI